VRKLLAGIVHMPVSSCRPCSLPSLLHAVAVQHAMLAFALVTGTNEDMGMPRSQSRSACQGPCSIGNCAKPRSSTSTSLMLDPACCRLLLMDGRTQLFVVEGNGLTFVDEYKQLPPYKELEQILIKREGSMASKGLVERMQAQAAFNNDSLTQQPPRS
jgi:hypothetical protein